MGTQLHGRATSAGYTPDHDRQPSPDPWRHAGTLVAVTIALLSSIVTYAVAQTRLEEQLKTKVDATAFEQLRADVRVLSTAICAETPKYCQSNSR